MNLSEVCKEAAKELNMDYDTVYNMAKFLFDFIAQVMKDKEDFHDILINNTFRFKLKNRFKNENNVSNVQVGSNVRS